MERGGGGGGGRLGHNIDRHVLTRQMMIIAGGDPEMCCRWHAKREGGVYGRPYALRVRKSCPECSVHVVLTLYVGKCEKWLVCVVSVVMLKLLIIANLFYHNCPLLVMFCTC